MQNGGFFRWRMLLSVALLVCSATVSTAQQGLPLAPIQSGPTALKPLGSGNNTMTLPEVWTPTKEIPLPAPPPALSGFEIPSPFIGCWEGNPHAFDEITFIAPNFYQIGVPGKIQFCYQDHSVDIPKALIHVSVLKGMQEFVENFGLGISTFRARGISTDVYQISPTHLRARTTLQLDITFHFLMVFPFHMTEPSLVDWEATLEGSNLLLIKADEVFNYNGQLIMAGTWHGYFHRLD